MYSYWKNNQLKIAPWIFLAPGILMFSLYVIFPIFQSINLSFYQWDGLGEKTYIGAENYIELLDDEYFIVSLKNNVIWLVLYLLAVPAGLLQHYFLIKQSEGYEYISLYFSFRLSYPRLLLAWYLAGFMTPLMDYSTSF